MNTCLDRPSTTSTNRVRDRIDRRRAEGFRVSHIARALIVEGVPITRGDTTWRSSPYGARRAV